MDGPINGEWFRTYVEKVLAPTLLSMPFQISPNVPK
jgi:hypothetical protein